MSFITFQHLSEFINYEIFRIKEEVKKTLEEINTVSIQKVRMKTFANLEKTDFDCTTDKTQELLSKWNKKSIENDEAYLPVADAQTSTCLDENSAHFRYAERNRLKPQLEKLRFQASKIPHNTPLLMKLKEKRNAALLVREERRLKQIQGDVAAREAKLAELRNQLQTSMHRNQ